VHRGSRITQQNLHPLQESIGKDNAQTFFFLIQKMNLSLMPSATRHGNHRRRADPVWLLVENDLYVSRRLASPVGIHFAADDTRDKAKSAVVAHTHYALPKFFLASLELAWGWCSVEAV
jgi:hypothetical protein